MPIILETYHRSLYGVAVIPRPAKIICDFKNISFLEEKIEPWVTNKSLTILGSEMITKSWFPSHMEYREPNFFAQ